MSLECRHKIRALRKINTQETTTSFGKNASLLLMFQEEKKLLEYVYNWGIACYVFSESNYIVIGRQRNDMEIAPTKPILILLACQKSPKSPIKEFMNSRIFDRNLFRVIAKLSGFNTKRNNIPLNLDN